MKVQETAADASFVTNNGRIAHRRRRVPGGIHTAPATAENA
jgi:hypothetical protein